MISPTLLFWIILAVVCFWLLIACLTLIGAEYHQAVRWHDLKVSVHRLRIEHNRRLQALRKRMEDAGDIGPSEVLTSTIDHHAEMSEPLRRAA